MEFLTIDNAVAFGTLSALEIVLGIDNVVYIAILCGRLPPHQRDKARFFGLSLAMLIRILLLMCIDWLAKLTTPLFAMSVMGHPFEPSVRDLVLGIGGLVLMAKATLEIHHQVESPHDPTAVSVKHASLGWVLFQICIVDIVFSIDSVITAIGMANNLSVMIAAIVLAVLVMMVCAGSVSRIVDRHPTLKTLALAFLILIGAALILESVHVEFPKGAIYFTMAFSLTIEMINLRMRSKSKKSSASV